MLPARKQRSAKRLSTRWLALRSGSIKDGSKGFVVKSTFVISVWRFVVFSFVETLIGQHSWWKRIFENSVFANLRHEASCRVHTGCHHLWHLPRWHSLKFWLRTWLTSFLIGPSVLSGCVCGLKVRNKLYSLSRNRFRTQSGEDRSFEFAAKGGREEVLKRELFLKDVYRLFGKKWWRLCRIVRK